NTSLYITNTEETMKLDYTDLRYPQQANKVEDIKSIPLIFLTS
ncbi:20607_t:CDS:1, partial [Gigaspora margarita]